MDMSSRDVTKLFRNVMSSDSFIRRHEKAILKSLQSHLQRYSYIQKDYRDLLNMTSAYASLVESYPKEGDETHLSFCRELIFSNSEMLSCGRQLWMEKSTIRRINYTLDAERPPGWEYEAFREMF